MAVPQCLVFPLALIALTGCAIQVVTLSPEIEGSFTINGEPAKGVEVFVGFSGNYDKPCPTVSTAQADSSGNFHISAVTARRLFVHRDSPSVYYICFKYQGELFIGDLSVHFPEDTNKYIAVCRVPVPPDAIAEDKLVCQWREAHG